MSLIRALHAELLKLKRTLAFRVIFVLPFFVALLQFFVIWRTKKFAAGFDLWQTHPENSFQIWAIFMMPLLITLETALLNGIEHSDKQWKHLFALPVPRRSIYLAKFIVALGLILVSTMVLALLTVIVGVVAVSLKPELAAITGPIPYFTIAKQATLVWLAGWFITAIHTWISMRWAGFAIALGAGIGGTFFALFAASASLGKYYPWLLPMNLFLEGRFTTALVLGIGGGVVAALLGCFEFVRRDVA
ncbi:MAG TPA: ABC transporter permease [Pyrinomonadaceae bacterium]